MRVLNWYLTGNPFASVIKAIILGGVLDTLFTPGHPNLALMAALLMAHVVPTFFIAFRDFDEEEEYLQRLVYTHAGPHGFGFFLEGVIRSIYLEKTFPQGTHEGTTVSVMLMTIIAVAVAISYWTSGTMSRGSRTADFLKAGFPIEIVRFILALREAGSPKRADEGMALLLDGKNAKRWFLSVTPSAFSKGVMPLIYHEAKLKIFEQEDTNRAFNKTFEWPEKTS